MIEVREQKDGGRVFVRLSAIDYGLLLAASVFAAIIVAFLVVAGIPFQAGEVLAIGSLLLAGSVFLLDECVLVIDVRIAGGRLAFRRPWLPPFRGHSIAVDDVRRVRVRRRHSGKGVLEVVDVHGDTHYVHLGRVDEAEGLRVAARLTELLESARPRPLPNESLVAAPALEWSEEHGRGVYRCELRAPRGRRRRDAVAGLLGLAVAGLIISVFPTVFMLLLVPVVAGVYLELRKAFARIRVTIDADGLHLARMWLGTTALVTIPTSAVARITVATKERTRDTVHVIAIHRLDGEPEELPWEFDDPDDAAWVVARVTHGLEAVTAHAEYR